MKCITLSPTLSKIDSDIAKLTKICGLDQYLTPTNTDEQFKHRMESKGQISPIFHHKRPDDNRFVQVQRSIDQLRSQLAAQEWDVMIWLYLEKLNELSEKTLLLQSYTHQDTDGIFHYNQCLFGGRDHDTIHTLRTRLPPLVSTPKGAVLSYDAVVDVIQKKLLLLWYADCLIISNPQLLSRMAVRSSVYPPEIILNPHAKIFESDIDALLVHEIDTHVARSIAWYHTGIQLFHTGTGYYRHTEEGLAMYHESLVMGWLPPKTSYHYIYLYEALQLDFVQASQMILSLRGLSPTSHHLQRVFRVCKRIKRWVTDTSVVAPGLGCRRDKVYLEWYHQIISYLQSGWALKHLMYGKIKLSDLSVLLD